MLKHLRSIVCVLGICLTIQAQGLPEGAKPYTPSRLEWLALEMSARLKVELTESSKFAMDFIGDEKENTILIVVMHTPSVNRRIMNLTIETARKIIESNGKSRDWSSWLKIKERIEMRDPEKDQ